MAGSDDGPRNGWRTGRDPVQRPLRVVGTIVCIAAFGYLAVQPPGARLDALPMAGLALAGFLLLVGYPVATFPGLGRIFGRKDEDE